ncbi:MAG: transcriptional regulator [Mycobacterium sp.]|nr:transcriptional regulator [Mycobacterium sp.]
MVDQNAITEARRMLGRRLAAYRQAAGFGQGYLAPLVHYSRSSLANVETGRQRGSRDFWQRCDELLTTGGALTAAHDDIEAMVRQHRQEAARPPRPCSSPGTGDPVQGSVRARVAQAARDSQGFLAQWESRCLGPRTADEFAEELSQIAADYVHQPLDGIFDDLVAARNRACALLGEQRRTSDTRCLLFMAALACGLLAHASMDLGDRRSAAHQIRVASRLATEVGHNALLAWIFGTQSLIAYCLQLPDRAVEFASRGEAVATSGTGRVRLAALKARGYALQCNGSSAKLALAMAEAARDDTVGHDDLDAMGGILDFPIAKQNYYAASTAALVSDGSAAEAYAQQAIDGYEDARAEQCSYGDLALSRVYLAQSRLLKPARRQDLAAAADALRAVFTLPPDQRIAGLHLPLRRTQALLRSQPLRHAREAAQLSDQVDGFLTNTRALTST